MGHYNCRECIERDRSSINELLINNNYFPNNSNQKKVNKEVILDLEKNFNKENKENKDNIDNCKTNDSVRQKLLYKKNNNTNEKGQNQYNNMQKEERENNILLKNELNKIKNLNNIEEISSVKNNEEIKENELNEENNENIDVKKEQQIEEDITKKQQELIEEQKETILNQQKIIEQYEQQNYEQQQLKLQEAQLKLKEQQLQLKLKELEFQGLDTDSKKQEKNLKKSSSNIKLKSPQQKLNISSNKSSPRKKIIKINFNQPEPPQLKENNLAQIKFKDEDKQRIDGQQEELGINKEEENEKDNKVYDNHEEENQEDENQVFEGYVKVDDLDEIEDRDPNYCHSLKFKIETYEPIEQDQKNENSENDDIGENTEKENSLKNKEINSKREENLEPLDNPNTEERIRVISKSKSNNNKDFYEIIKKREEGPKDSSNKIANFQFRGTFRKEREKNREFLQKIKKRKSGPKDSKKKVKKNNKNYNKCNLNEFQYHKKKYYPRDKKREEPLNSDCGNNAEIGYIKQYNNIITNPIASAINNEVLNNDNYDTEINLNNYNVNNNIISNNNNKNYQTKYFVNNNNIPSVEFPQRFLYPNDNNVFVRQDMDVEPQGESPKFNKIVETQNMGNFNEANENGEIQQQYRESDKYGPYVDQMDGFNFTMSSDPIIYHNNEFDKYPSFNDNEQNQNKSNNSFYDIQRQDKDNQLIYSDDMGNMNYLEKKYMIYKNQFNQNNFDEKY